MSCVLSRHGNFSGTANVAMLWPCGLHGHAAGLGVATDGLIFGRQGPKSFNLQHMDWASIYD
jgi:hypothetical protein